jgi:hypothetical protein
MNRSASQRRLAGTLPLVLPAGICLVVLFGGLAVGVALGGVMPLPYGPAAAVHNYVRGEPLAIQVIGLSVFGSSIPLAIYAATASSRLRRLGASRPEVTLALTGGTLAAGALALTASLAWTLSRPEVSTDTAVVSALYYLVFLVGGPGHLVALGLLVAGMALAGLPAGLLPTPAARAGLVIAALAESTTLVLVWPGLGVILPIARVAALLWLVLAGAMMPTRG